MGISQLGLEPSAVRGWARDSEAAAPRMRAGHPEDSRYHTPLVQQGLEEYGSIGGHELVMG